MLIEFVNGFFSFHCDSSLCRLMTASLAPVSLTAAADCVDYVRIQESVYTSHLCICVLKCRLMQRLEIKVAQSEILPGDIRLEKTEIHSEALKVQEKRKDIYIYICEYQILRFWGGLKAFLQSSPFFSGVLSFIKRLRRVIKKRGRRGDTEEEPV